MSALSLHGPDSTASTPHRVRARALPAASAGCLLAAAAALLLVGGPATGSASAATAATAPTVVVSPLPGTPDANPATQISFLGVPGSHLRDVVVKGSRSGSHGGRLRYYSTHNGGSFLPARPFEPGEHVTVSATVVGYGAPARISTSFGVSSPYTLPPSKPRVKVPVTSTNVVRFHSRHDLLPPAVTVKTPPADPTLGDVLISPDSGPGQAGPMIISPLGRLVWFEPLPTGTTAFDLNVQSYQGVPVLTWWQGTIVQGHGQGADMIESSHYTPIATIRAGNGLYADLHDFQITPQGTAWITAYAPQHMDLSSIHGPHHGLIDDGVVQEIDIKTGLVMFEWHALGHVAIADSYANRPKADSTVFDYFHLNSVDPLADGNVLISSRNTWATYLINGTTGALIWRLGGKQSSFNLGTGVSFAWQHDAEMLPDGTISLFNNEASPAEAKESSVLDIAVDIAAGTATLVHQFTYPGQGILSESQGDVQLLANGDSFVGWGQVGEISEFSSSGALTFDMQVATPASTYRAFRYVWNAQPLTAPALVAATPGRSATELYTSWNGATTVASWRVLAGASRGKLAAVGTFPSTGFETAISAPTTAAFVRVQALSASGAVLRSSAVVKT